MDYGSGLKEGKCTLTLTKRGQKKRTIGSSLKKEKREKVLDERQEAYRRTTPFIFFMRLVFLLSPGDMLGFLVPCPSSKYPVAGSALSGVAPDGGKVGRSLLVWASTRTNGSDGESVLLVNLPRKEFWVRWVGLFGPSGEEGDGGCS